MQHDQNFGFSKLGFRSGPLDSLLMAPGFYAHGPWILCPGPLDSPEASGFARGREASRLRESRVTWRRSRRASRTAARGNARPRRAQRSARRPCAQSAGTSQLQASGTPCTCSVNVPACTTRAKLHCSTRIRDFLVHGVCHAGSRQGA